MPTTTLADAPDVQHFLAQELAATIAVPIEESGTLHAASLIFWHDTDPLRLYFVTSKNTEKCSLLVKKDSLPAACVVGTQSGTKMTLQMRGVIRVVDKNNHKRQLEKYYEKRGNHHDDIIDPLNVLLEFTPSWARYTDYTKGYERHMLDVGGNKEVMNDKRTWK